MRADAEKEALKVASEKPSSSAAEYDSTASEEERPAEQSVRHRGRTGAERHADRNLALPFPRGE